MKIAVLYYVIGDIKYIIMKKLYMFIVTFILVCNFAIGQKTIRMEKDGGIYKISCKVNGAPMKMYFDTGASTVSISRATALYLLENDLIGSQDFRGKTQTATADGSISDKMVINLRDIEIAGLHLRDVQATVSYSLNAPLLLGQTAIQRLGKISLQGNILTIHTNTSKSSQNTFNREELDKKLRYLRDIRETYGDSSYDILEIIDKIEAKDQLNEFELFCKTMSLANILKYDDAIFSAQTWIDKYATNTDSIDWKMRVFFTAGEANILSEYGDMEKGMEYLRRCENYWKRISNKTSVFYWLNLPMIYDCYCCSNYKTMGYWLAINAAKESLKTLLKIDNITLSDINNNRCNNWEYKSCLAILWHSYLNQYKLNIDNNYQPSQYEYDTLINISILTAKAGVELAIDYLRSFDIDYKRILTRDELSVIGIE